MIVGIASGDFLSPQRAKDGAPHWGGAGWARLGQYQHLIENHHIVVGSLTWQQGVGLCIKDDRDILVPCDIIYMQRLMHDTLPDHMKKARAMGQVIINDLDDWYWGLDPQNGAFASSHPKRNPKENVNHYKKVLASSTVVTVSTQYLADRIKEWVRCPIHVLENTVDVMRFAPVVDSGSNVPMVGWVGSTSHRSGDLEILQGIISPLVDRGEIRFQHSGHYPQAESVASRIGLDEDQVTVHPATDARNYPALLTMEVGLAPLRDTPFNHAKSDIKLLEYSAAGIPWIGSALSAYEALRKKWGVGRTASNPTQWLKHLHALRDPDTRADEAEALRDAVWARDISHGAQRLQSLFDLFG